MNTRIGQRGSSLLEPLIAIVILCVGILGIARFQINAVVQTTDARTRAVATSFTEELLTYVRTDHANSSCYTLPQAGECASDAAKALSKDWESKVKKALPGFESVTVGLAGSKLTVTVKWVSKAFKEGRVFEVNTDVR
ncbi:hypothetical protein LC612_37510 [Nostoc sp. CHAB 5834]|nr:hypothetical protein [Nostoc sp. CHAB 5834]